LGIGISHEKAINIMTKGDNRTNPEELTPKVLAAFVKIETERAQGL